MFSWEKSFFPPLLPHQTTLNGISTHEQFVQFIEIKINDKNTSLNAHLLDSYHHLLWSSPNIAQQSLILPVICRKEFANLQEMTSYIAKLFLTKYTGSFDKLNTLYDVQMLRSVKVHIGKKCFSFDEDSESVVNQSIDDEIMIEVKGILKFHKNCIISTENLMYIYQPNQGIWLGLKPKEMRKYLLSEYYKSNKPIKFVNAVYQALDLYTHQESFPHYVHEHSVLVLQNCAIVPATGEILEFSPDHYARNKLPFSHDENATCPIWETFINETFDDENDANLLQEYMGLSLTNITLFQVLLLLYGFGSNGKSIVLEILSCLLGEANVSKVPFKDFSKDFSLINLHNKLINIDADLDYDSLKNQGRIKSIIAGEELAANVKNKNHVKVKFQLKLWGATNILPKVSSNTHGFYRRIIILKFNKTIPREKQNKQLASLLKTELAGIFLWSLKGLKRLLQNGKLTIPKSSELALEEYQLENNHIKIFFNETLDYGKLPKERMIKADVYDLYRKFASNNGFTELNSSKFGVELAALNVESLTSSGKRYYKVKLRDSANDSSESASVAV